jgi:DnaJ-class molecular chaperone
MTGVFAGLFQSPRPKKKPVAAAADDGGRAQAKEYMLRARSQYRAANGGVCKPIENWYQVLGLENTVSQAVVKKRYLKLALLLHPDRQGRTPIKGGVDKALEEYGASSDWNKVSKAYQMLGDVEDRKR